MGSEYQGRHKRELTKSELNDQLGEAQKYMDTVEATLGSIAAQKMHGVIDDDTFQRLSDTLRNEMREASDEEGRILTLL